MQGVLSITNQRSTRTAQTFSLLKPGADKYFQQLTTQRNARQLIFKKLTPRVIARTLQSDCNHAREIICRIRFQAGNIPFREVGASKKAGRWGTPGFLAFSEVFSFFSPEDSSKIVEADAQALEHRGWQRPDENERHQAV
jgi:hypothetical protein